MSDSFHYDLFLSHSAKDKAVVRPLAERLRKDGVKVWFDEWALKPGDSIPSKIEEGLERSRVLVLCLSANAFGSDWAQLESGTFRFCDTLSMNDIQILKLWIISPNLPKERDCVRTAVTPRLNKHLEDAGLPYRIESVGWEDLPALAGRGPQDQIDRAFLSNSDIVLGFMRGSADAQPGTLHEFEAAVEGYRLRGVPRIVLFYFGRFQAPKTSAESVTQRTVLEFRSRLQQEGLTKDYTSISDFQGKIEDDLFALIAKWPRRLQHPELLRTRSAIYPHEWRAIFSAAQERIWLMGHSLNPVVDQRQSGSVLCERLKSGVEIRLLVLDPSEKHNDSQIAEIELNLKVRDLRRKILDTLAKAAELIRLARVRQSPRRRANRSKFRLGLTKFTMHSSIVIVDQRYLVTMYSHLLEAGDMGVTLDLNETAAGASPHADICGFFEWEFIWQWDHARVMDEKEILSRSV